MVKKDKRSKVKKHKYITEFSLEQINSSFDRPDYYYNRELSWLLFNRRVIEEAYDASNPLLEQLNFLAIASSNLDEFFMVRVAGVYEQYSNEVKVAENKTKLSPLELLTAIRESNTLNVDLQYQRYHQLVKELDRVNYSIKQMHQLSREELDQARRIFQQLIQPTLSPLGIDAYRPFPFLVNKAINILVSLEDEDGRDKTAIIPIPSLLDRYVLLTGGHATIIVLIEDIISYFIQDLFKGFKVNFSFPFRITRDADFEIQEDETDDLLEAVEDYVKQRKNGHPVRIEIDSHQNLSFKVEQIDYLTEKLDLEDFDIYEIKGPLDLTYLFNLVDIIGQALPTLRYRTFKPYLNHNHKGEALFTTMKEKDLFFYHPYDAFDPIVNFIQAAANDECTIAIKQTLYRVSRNSPIISALKQAAQNGKEVTVLVELKARFDEENNMNWAVELEEAGCHVLYGVSELKTHSKITLIIRKEDNHIQSYVHLGTGNYNDRTAKIYTDMGLLTTHPALIQDAIDFFNYLSGYRDRPHYQALHVSPFEIRDSLIELIHQEIEFQKKYQNGHIIAKMNSLTDKPLIQKLYEASQAGVKIDLIIRGICCLKPGIPGISDNIRVISIVGRFLEHARIYYFNHNHQPLTYLSSADMMTRNMIKRVEIEFPIIDPQIAQQIYEILLLQLADTAKARELSPDGTYVSPLAQSGVQLSNSQEQLMRQAQQKDEQDKLTSQVPTSSASLFTRILHRFKKNK